jgi:hypothetical protein
LFESVEAFPESINFLSVLVAWRLLHINLLLKLAIEEGRFDVVLADMVVPDSCYREKQSKRRLSCNWREDFIVILAEFLASRRAL